MTGQPASDGYAKCGAKKRQGEGTCTRPAGWGTDHAGVGHCKLHGGKTPTHAKAASVELARQACEQLGVPIVVDPGEALLQELWETAGNVAFYRQLVQELPAHPEPASTEEIVGGPEDGEEKRIPARTGVYGPTWHVSGFATGEAKPHVLVVLYNEERKHLAAVAAAALKAGVEERRVRVAESQAQLIAEFGRGLLRELGIDPSSEPARVAFRKHLTLIAGGQSG